MVDQFLQSYFPNFFHTNFFHHEIFKTLERLKLCKKNGTILIYIIGSYEAEKIMLDCHISSLEGLDIMLPLRNSLDLYI